MADADFVMDGSQPLDPRKTIFVGGVPRPLRAGVFIFWEFILYPNSFMHVSLISRKYSEYSTLAK